MAASRPSRMPSSPTWAIANTFFVAIDAMIAATRSPAMPATKSALMLLSILATTHAASSPSSFTGSGRGWTDQHTPTSDVGTTATTGASIPAVLRHASSQDELPLMTMRDNPIAIRPPTRMARTGV